ncbi:ThuA domain-containing protein [Aestuariicella hydrocarbonica]|uniref:ThuA domain-containing protein n=1 Tax=Pseudomaricurvus hydrocarbonicus TaxID=1470433 RepID=A0A9E5MMB7_9GAMM|nr:ThuA domain-containing protein [Aestuariicella hydrocarbonica]NHO66848.1 ThuA domain-containing protein [Aestuariicella hydrocarbonica]
MSVIDYQSQTRLLLSVKGHPYDRDAFFDLFEGMPAVSYTTVEQPASQAFFAPELAKQYQLHVLYDMPGLDFSSQPPGLMDPPAHFKQNFLDLLEEGHGFLFLHHAIASWPTWSEYAEIVGGRFLYRPGNVRGNPCLDSGYRHDVTYTAKVQPWLPITQGVPECFSITDELYLYEVFEADVEPLVRGDYPPHWQHFYSAANAGVGQMYSNDNWLHPRGSELLGWVKHYKNSPIVYLQMGDGSSAYGNPHYQRLLYNAVSWLASDAALDWARNRNLG